MPQNSGFPLPARNVYCVGRNYPAHARELGNDVPAEPIIFLKPTTALVHPHESLLELPLGLGQIDFEAEIVVQVARLESGVLGIGSVAVGLDLTARQVQAKLKEQRLPWTLAKGLKGFAPVGAAVSWRGSMAEFTRLEVSFELNGELRQRGVASQMLFGVDTLIAWLEPRFALGAGDLIFTGTPPGVGPLAHGDELDARLTLDGTLLSTLSTLVHFV